MPITDSSFTITSARQNEIDAARYESENYIEAFSIFYSLEKLSSADHFPII